MKVLIANIFIKNGDIEYNYNLFKKFYLEAVNSFADLVIFPRLFLTGICSDFTDLNFINKSVKYLENIIELTENKSTSIIIGGIYYLNAYTKNEINYDSIINDSVFFIKNGYLEEIISRKEYAKNNEFDDYKFFDKSLYLKNFEYKYKKFSIFLSDDIYYDENIFLLKSQNTDFLICLDSTKRDSYIIKDRLNKISKFFRKPIIYLNNAIYINNNFLNGDIVVIDENQNLLISDNYETDKFYDLYLDYEDGSEVYVKDKIINHNKNNEIYLLNKLSEIENKKILFINNDKNYELLKNYKNKQIDFSQYCSLYNRFSKEDKKRFEKIAVKYIIGNNYILYQ